MEGEDIGRWSDLRENDGGIWSLGLGVVSSGYGSGSGGWLQDAASGRCLFPHVWESEEGNARDLMHRCSCVLCCCVRKISKSVTPHAVMRSGKVGSAPFVANITSSSGGREREAQNQESKRTTETEKNKHQQQEVAVCH